ncbi:MAG: hypothetical protein HC792_05490 [Acaryochloridaceae cyanobacterium CSU_5_19]|nr:hypothetical protein [Acaryochloridaceae cyanobacterium CSU_5_19]
MSGGTNSQNHVQEGLKLRDGQGTAFYEFMAIADPKAFKVKYRQTLNQLAIDGPTALRIVAEANHAFSLNMQLFQELEGNLIQSLGKLLFSRLTHRSLGKTNALPA